MPRYFFNVHDTKPIIDTEGEELPDAEAAWREAIKFAGAIFHDVDGKFRPGQEWSLEVADEARRPVYFIVISSKRMQ
ncbi:MULTISPECIES: hypothetical protein [unclassified Bradyrhizobium]|uniref:DUF6894 family protein n=1 Tax=unclassified Bradyrhizobium TaxID=2631580 RepID=UPI0024B1E3F3|nr:hypothetical protein [Bradyrhizobium sp. CB2312]WFU75214.1 hypothetical protein QA642_14900 [Bradyrhizobium sp. CB2312]